MNELQAACKKLKIHEKQVLSYTVYKDHIAVVVDLGGRGCPKYKIPLDELPDQEPPDPITPEVKRKTTRRRAIKK